jgi:cardiolipin synthase A/B
LPALALAVPAIVAAVCVRCAGTARAGRPHAALLAALLAAGCALNPPSPAPPPAHSAPAPAASAPRVHGADGALPPARAKRVLRRLDQQSQGDLLARHVRATEHLVAAPLRVGNSVELLIDGPATHRAMFAAIEAAKDHVNLETYILEADPVGLRLAELLLRKREQGVVVKVIYDSVGSRTTPPEYFDQLRQAGVHICEYNPVNPFRAKGGWRINNRDHRKILVVDGRVGFTGGINISSVYSSGSFSRRRRQAPVEDGWRDTHVEARGPVVHDLQRLFLATWRAQCGPLADTAYFPDVEPAGNKVMRVIAGEPGESEVYAALLSAIERAERTIYLTIGYFVPDPRTLTALHQAAARGVDVRLALPGVSDFWAPLHAGRSHYADLLASGVRIYERHDALLHAKTGVVDGVWSTVGSTNVDWRSFVHNAEANVEILDAAFAQRMEDLFWMDVEHSIEITAEAWGERSTGARVKEWFARQWEYLL